MRFLIPFCLLFMLFSCHSKRDVARVPFAEVNGEYLYQDEIQEVIPENVLPEDSVSVAQNYVRNWITNVLLYEHAERNIQNKEQIDELTEAYRQSLIIHQYRQSMLQERFTDEPSETQLHEFYDQNKDKFLLTETVVQGIFIKVSLDAPKLEYLVQNLQNYNKKSLENIEKYTIQNAAEYDYFGDRWLPISQVLKKIPLGTENQSQIPIDQSFISFKDSTHYYLLRVLDRRKAGEIEPYGLAKEKVSLILTNQQKTDFIKNFEQNIYDEAVRKGKVKFFNPEEEEL